MSSPRPFPRTIRLIAPLLTMVLAATAIPIELQRPDLTQLSFSAFGSDVLLNIAGYMPLGLVLASRGPASVGAVAAAIATLAEVSQLFMVHRQASGVDVVCNVIGAILGALVVPRLRRTISVLVLDQRAAAVAAVLAGGLMFFVWWRSPLPLNDRGWTAPGTLEAHWNFDESDGRIAEDSSGHDLDGTFRNDPERVRGIFGTGVILDGTTDYVDAGRATAFRLVGSMTVSAWINAAAFPADDAAIVSSHNGVGYQLDTTIDRGPRTVGFKLGNACGRLMARYGATPLVTGRWYHLAGVYDAPAKSLDVYVDGQLDNGFLQGTVTGSQRNSREPVYIGRRSSDRGFEFAGLIDDVRIYSRALTSAEIAANMRGMPVSVEPSVMLERDHRDREGVEEPQCFNRSDGEDAQIPGAAGALGVLVAVMYLGFWPTASWLPCLAVGVSAGLLLLPGAGPSMPSLGRWLIPLTSLAGAFSVLASLSVANSRYER